MCFFSCKGDQISEVHVQDRIDALLKRDKPPMIYHYTNITRPNTTFNIQLKVTDPALTRVVILGRHEKLPTLKDCDLVKVMSWVELTDGTEIPGK